MTFCIWVFGASASGKETFIRSLEQKNQADLLVQLGWNNKKILIIEKSLEYIAKNENEIDEIREKRKEILDEVKNITEKENAIILIKGQDWDLESGIVQDLHDMYDQFHHQIVFLDVDLSLLYERCRKKFWWDKELDVPGTLEEWLEYQVELLKKLRGFEYITLQYSVEKQMFLFKNREL